MKKFLVLYQSTVPASEQMKNATPEQAKAGMDAWMSWAGRAGSGIVDMGSPSQRRRGSTGQLKSPPAIRRSAAIQFSRPNRRMR